MSAQPLTDAEISALAALHLKAFAQNIGAGNVWYEGEHEFAQAIIAADRAKRLEALRWTAGALQALVKNRRTREKDLLKMGGESKTVAEVLDMANAALEPVQNHDS